MNISDLIHPNSLARVIENGYVRAQGHPMLPYRILNYTEKAAYEGVWSPITRTCRGLIYSTTTGEILARPFEKFFNWGQDGCADIMLTSPVHVTDKLDGSLGILYPTTCGWAVATRGSFTSEQAEHATKVLRERYPDFTPPAGLTVLFEVIYPTNRIVVDYAGLDDLVLLGAVGIDDGAVYDPTWIPDWDGPVTETFACATFADALRHPPRENAEGIVVRCLKTGGMVKIKQADYVALHRIVTGLNARTVWQHLLAGKPLAELIEPLPDEFRPWVEEVAAGIETTVRREAWRLEEEYTRIRDAMPDHWQAGDRASRAEFAKLAAPHPDKWAMFHLLDGKDIRSELLKRADPGPCITPTGRTYTEETA